MGLPELLLEGAGQLVEQTHLLTVLQEARRGRRLVWNTGDTIELHIKLTLEWILAS